MTNRSRICSATVTPRGNLEPEAVSQTERVDLCPIRAVGKEKNGFLGPVRTIRVRDMSVDLQNLDTSAMKGRLSSLRRFL